MGCVGTDTTAMDSIDKGCGADGIGSLGRQCRSPESLAKHSGAFGCVYSSEPQGPAGASARGGACLRAGRTGRGSHAGGEQQNKTTQFYWREGGRVKSLISAGKVSMQSATLWRIMRDWSNLVKAAAQAVKPWSKRRITPELMQPGQSSG